MCRLSEKKVQSSVQFRRFVQYYYSSWFIQFLHMVPGYLCCVVPPERSLFGAGDCTASASKNSRSSRSCLSTISTSVRALEASMYNTLCMGWPSTGCLSERSEVLTTACSHARRAAYAALGLVSHRPPVRGRPASARSSAKLASASSAPACDSCGRSWGDTPPRLRRSAEEATAGSSGSCGETGRAWLLYPMRRTRVRSRRK